MITGKTELLAPAGSPEALTAALRCGAVSNPDGSVSVCVVNNGVEPLPLSFACDLPQKQPFRRYTFSVERVPDNPFADLPAWDGLLDGARAVDQEKRGHLRQAAQIYLSAHPAGRVRFDVMEISAAGVRHIKNAF